MATTTADDGEKRGTAKGLSDPGIANEFDNSLPLQPNDENALHFTQTRDLPSGTVNRAPPNTNLGNSEFPTDGEKVIKTKDAGTLVTNLPGNESVNSTIKTTPVKGAAAPEDRIMATALVPGEDPEEVAKIREDAGVNL